MHRVLIRAVGGPEQIVWEEAPGITPREGEVLVRVETAGVAFGDVLLRRGVAGGRFPVTPGYDLVGVVEALGHGATRFKVGERVAGFPGQGAQQEQVSLREHQLAPVPAGVAPEKAVAVVLNYVTALQLLTYAALKPGDSAFIYGLAGGLGSAMRQVAAQLGINLYGTASRSRLAEASRGATAFDRDDPDWVAEARGARPGGFHAVFDPLGGASLNLSYRLVAREGTLVMIGTAASVQGKGNPRLGVLGTLARFGLLKLRPGTRRARIFLVQGPKKDTGKFQREMATLYEWLVEEKIDPRIHAVLPLKDAKAAQEILERGEVEGKIILKASE